MGASDRALFFVPKIKTAEDVEDAEFLETNLAPHPHTCHTLAFPSSPQRPHRPLRFSLALWIPASSAIVVCHAILAPQEKDLFRK